MMVRAGGAASTGLARAPAMAPAPRAPSLAGMRVPLAPLLLLSAALHAPGEDLVFDDPDQLFHPGASDSEVVAHYRFTNRGRAALTISPVRPTCGCTTTTLEKTTYQPGESGEIIADFSISDRGGMQDKLIEVYHDQAPPQVLHLRADLPEGPTITPNFVSWLRFEDRLVRLVSISFPPGTATAAMVTAAIPSNPLVSAELVAGKPGQWTLRVTPSSTSVAGNAMIVLHTPSERTYYIFASVVDDLKPPPP
jgi:hypothetical protein